LSAHFLSLFPVRRKQLDEFDEYVFPESPKENGIAIRVRTGDLQRIYASIPNPVSTFGEDEDERFVIRKVEKTA